MVDNSGHHVPLEGPTSPIRFQSPASAAVFVCVQLRKEQVESVNVGGTKNIINGEETRRFDGVLVHFQPAEGDCAACPVCMDRSIPRLVYTSTINVVFTGEPLKDCDESSASHVPPDKVSITKSPPFPPDSVLKGWF